MANVRNNERSEAINLISHINSYLSGKTWCIVSAGGERTITAGTKHMFPDVILYGDSAQTKIMQGWELKMPDVAINDPDFVFDAQRKAITLGLNSCFIWNFTYGVLYKRNDDDSFTEIKRWSETSYIHTRDDVDKYKADWTRTIDCILSDINNYFLCGEFKAATIGEFVADTLQSEIILRNKGIVADSLRNSTIVDARIGATVSLWWEQVKTEYVSDEADAFSAYSRIVLINWTNRILFAHLIKAEHNVAREIENLSFESTPEEANTLFTKISSICDFYNIFSAVDYNDKIPDNTWTDLMEMNAFLTECAFAQYTQLSLQTVLERTVSTSKRELVGQFTTPEKLAEILTAITMVNLTDDCIDPCCGTGSIAYAILSQKITHGMSVDETYRTTWASDKYSFPLQVASISLARCGAINQPLRIFQGNVFNLSDGHCIDVVNPTDGKRNELRVPKFGNIISNLPFVPFEIIADDEQGFINAIESDVYRNTGILLDDRSDLYQYIILSLWNALKDNGRAGFITSNSWLGTKSGRKFFDAMSQYYTIDQLHISGSGRWFGNADVVTVILILTKKNSPAIPNPDEKTQFYIWRKSLQDMGKTDVEKLTAQVLLGRRNATSELYTMCDYSMSEIKTILGMNISINSLFHNIEWLPSIASNLCPVAKYLIVTRGERRGWDKMFYPTAGHRIEAKYIKKVLKSSRQLSGLYALPDSDAFCCSDSIESLEKDNCVGALQWIRSFKHERNGVGKPLPLVLKRANMYWYEMKDTNTADFVTGMNPDRRLFVSKFDEPTFVNQRLIAFRCNDTVDNKEIIHALLNSVIGLFYIEAIGFGRGLGALDINATNIGNMFMLDPELLSDEDKCDIIAKFKVVCSRDILPVSVELKKEDRIEFDHAVLKAYHIDCYYDKICDALYSMQHIRHTAAE